MKDPRFSFIGDLASNTAIDVASLLGGTAIRIEIGRRAITSFCGQVIAFQLATLLARLFDRVEFIGNNSCPVNKDIKLLRGPFLPALRAHLLTLRPMTAVPETGRLVRVQIGDDETSTADVYVGAVEWVALLSVSRPQPIGDGSNPIGALASGALCAGEVFKHVFGQNLTGALLASDLKFSLLTYTSVDDVGLRDQPTIPNEFKVDAVLVGSGSVGCAFALALMLAPSASGSITVVDNGVFDANNPYKYVLLDAASAREQQAKARWIRGRINRQSSGNVRAEAFVGTADTYLATLPENYRIAVAVSAVDTLEARLAIQDMLPAKIVNAGIAGTLVEVSSHNFGEGPCLGCLIMQQSMESWNALPLATRTGLSVERVRTMIVTNAPLTEQDMFAMITAGVLSRELVTELPDYVGQPLLSFLNRVLYAETRLVSTDGKPGARVTTAFVSAYAGTLLFAEFVKAASVELARFRLNNSYRQDMIGIPADGPYRYPRDPDGACCCFSAFRIRMYNEKYGPIRSELALRNHQA